ncbi:VOC family protein [Nocardia jiangxiensis]|uniref:VOC family protein n=1 Tax=Nocardia jiangxiensis TaxID=282685 RepID=A0ABW6SC42_9NOCA
MGIIVGHTCEKQALRVGEVWSPWGKTHRSHQRSYTVAGEAGTLASPTGAEHVRSQSMAEAAPTLKHWTGGPASNNMHTMTTVKPGSIWHIGFIVDNVDTAMADLTAALGLSWADIHHVKANLQGLDGRVYRVDSRVVFSVDQPVSIELIEPSHDTPLVRRGDSAFHHIGYWSENLVAEQSRLDEHSWPCLAYRPADQGDRRIQLSEGPFGILIEACSTLASRPGLEHFYPDARS